MTFLFILTPIVAVVGNMIITSQIQNPQAHFTEIYLIIFWTLTVSGLRFLHATLSAFGVVLISSLSIFYFFPASQELWILHLFWLLTSFSFAFFGGYMLEKRNKDAFLAYEELIAIAATDSENGFQSKIVLNELIEIEISRFKRYKHPFSIVLVSIDDFKETKVMHGHKISDLFLIEIAKLIKEHVRLTDVVVRLEDEKFVIIYQETDGATVKILVEKLRRTIEAYSFKSVGQKTMSAGLSTHIEHDDSESIVLRLSEALHKAKAKGKNHIVFL
jgi:diguanylate cyclase (GGDEF)-like protein